LCRPLKWITIGMLLLFLSACAPLVSVPPTAPPRKPAPKWEPPPPKDTQPAPQPEVNVPEPPPEEKPPPVVKQPSPRALAALELTEQGRVMIEKNRPDAAIRVLERAVNLYPQNGQNYFYLAEAWLEKGNLSQAREFHRLAGIYLGDDTAWASRLKIQELKIKNY
jgi:tetratricopeptide (TPR) repeat protein